MIEAEPELISIIEGPTPDFRPSPYLWFQSVLEGPEDTEIVMCELRTFNGEDIVNRCRNAWTEDRAVKLDYPDYLRLRRQIDVVALRLQDSDEGPMIVLWLRQPYGQAEEERFDGSDDDLGL
ncbi:MAG TPA: hypothetical protein VFI27_22820 [candidate division Zixibacteria bacterium]|nr:hypothetical protein [candidate division Zixibacteria bacterium]